MLAGASEVTAWLTQTGMFFDSHAAIYFQATFCLGTLFAPVSNKSDFFKEQSAFTGTGLSP